MEEWKAIKGYEGLYEVSNFGRIKSLSRIVTLEGRWGKYSRTKGERIMAQMLDGQKHYLMVSLCKNGTVKRYLVHRLVAQAFVENPYNLPEVNHKDENKTNNHFENLEWCTHQYNSIYGTRKAASRGERNAANKFSEQTVRQIKSEFIPGDPEKGLTALALKYGISRSHLCAILHGNRWGWLE